VILHRHSVVVAEAEERRGGLEIMPHQGIGAIDLEQFDEVFCRKLRKPVRSAHALIVHRPRRQGEAECLIPVRGLVEIAHGHHDVIY